MDTASNSTARRLKECCVQLNIQQTMLWPPKGIFTVYCKSKVNIGRSLGIQSTRITACSTCWRRGADTGDTMQHWGAPTLRPLAHPPVCVHWWGVSLLPGHEHFCKTLNSICCCRVFFTLNFLNCIQFLVLAVHCQAMTYTTWTPNISLVLDF